MDSWQVGHACVVGTSHVATNSPCQDAAGCLVAIAADGSEILIAAISDGAGSAAHSEKGSRRAVDSFLEEVSRAATNDPGLTRLDEAWIMRWLRKVHLEIAEAAQAAGHAPTDYACTLLGAVVGPTLAVYVQLGDGAIVVREPDDERYSWMFWPQNGEYANTTNFLTQVDFEDAVQIGRSDTPPEEVAIFSDGIERLVLDMSARTVHAPALAPIFQWLAKTGARNDAGGENPGLVAFLKSEKVNSRTDDDKSLIVATRAAVQSD